MRGPHLHNPLGGRELPKRCCGMLTSPLATPPPYFMPLNLLHLQRCTILPCLPLSASKSTGNSNPGEPFSLTGTVLQDSKACLQVLKRVSPVPVTTPTLQNLLAVSAVLSIMMTDYWCGFSAVQPSKGRSNTVLAGGPFCHPAQDGAERKLLIMLPCKLPTIDKAHSPRLAICRIGHHGLGVEVHSVADCLPIFADARSTETTCLQDS